VGPSSFSRGGNQNAGSQYLKEAAALKPSELEPHQRMALIYKQTGHPEQARAEQQKLNQLTKSSND
jgi:Flp pilus assembly protein TadD